VAPIANRGARDRTTSLSCQVSSLSGSVFPIGHTYLSPTRTPRISPPRGSTLNLTLLARRVSVRAPRGGIASRAVRRDRNKRTLLPRPGARVRVIKDWDNWPLDTVKIWSLLWTTKKTCHCWETLINRVHLPQDTKHVSIRFNWRAIGKWLICPWCFILPGPRKANYFLQKLSHGLSKRRRRFLQARGPSRRRPRPARALPYVHPCTASAPVKPVLPSRREGKPVPARSFGGAPLPVASAARWRLHDISARFSCRKMGSRRARLLPFSQG